MFFLKSYKCIPLIFNNHLGILRWQSTITKRLDKILIANRGEIACRVIRSAKKLGIKTVAVYSEADRNSLHVLSADEAYEIGPPSATQSYLNSQKILEVAKKSESKAIHPGYGFLSENVEFADACKNENIIFIGPTSSAIRDMGIKSTAKRIMANAGVPIIEGYHGDDQSDETLLREAKRIGFPVMIKAVRGGGGKGMRVSHSEQDFLESLSTAKSESQKSFADSIVLLEKFIEEPRHVEVQIFGDNYGNVVHLYERDCSVQRRHQKIIEEAPAPGLTKELQNKLGSAAVRAAQAVGYIGAGTVEFILDRHSNNFHFMEMNTRLQVEHPITEMITNIDLVEWQIRIASGEKLPKKQDEIQQNGHAFEARIYAEESANGEFLPGAGHLDYLNSPLTIDQNVIRSNVRVETGVRQSDEVSIFYDPMIAKLVVWGDDRDKALSLLNKNLLMYNIAGLETNVNFLLKLTNHPEFQNGKVHTNFIKENFNSLFTHNTVNNEQLIEATLAYILLEKLQQLNQLSSDNKWNPFVLESNFRINHYHIRDVKLEYNDKEFVTKVKFTSTNNRYEVSCDNGNTWKTVEATLNTDGNRNILTCSIDQHMFHANVFKNDKILAIFNQNGKLQFSIPPTNNFDTDNELASESNTNKAVAPMPGILDKILINVGDNVKKGDSLFILIAMKMEYVVKATRDATITNICYKIGDCVEKDSMIVQFDQKQ